MFGSTSTQIEQNQPEQRRDAAPPPPVHRQAAGARVAEHDGANDQPPNPLWQDPWHLQIRQLPAEDKITVCHAILDWEEKQDQYVLKNTGLSDEPKGEVLCLLKKDSDQKPKNIKAFYEQITPYMRTKSYWINYASYATGDLTSLAASVINDPRHGISMYWELIGEADPDKNMEILRSFLGGVVDRGKGGERYVVTRDGAKGQWANGPAKSKGNQADDELAGDELADAKLLDAAFSCLSAGKKLYYLVHTLQDSLTLALSTPSAALAAERFSVAARALSKTREAPAEEPSEPPIQAAIQAGIAAARSVVTLVESFESQTSLDQNTLQFKADMLSLSENLDTYTAQHTRDEQIDALFDGAARMVESVSAICSAAQSFQKNNSWTAPPPQAEAPGQRKPGRLKFEHGTKMIAVSWDREKRKRVREAWGVGLEEGQADYDGDVEDWLHSKGIPPDTAVHAKQIVVMWIRKSGERGGAHFENDTSFRVLGEQAREYVRRGFHVFLAGDEKEGKAARLASDRKLAGHIFNITQFWADRSEKLKKWGGNSRTGQFRLYDYLKRKASSLVHVGAMSGNLEAMALLGHKVEFHAGDPEGPGVMRMQAYTVHDLGVGARDKLSYDLKSVPYGKPAAHYYIDLKLRGKRIYEAICSRKPIPQEEDLPDPEQEVQDETRRQGLRAVHVMWGEQMWKLKIAQRLKKAYALLAERKRLWKEEWWLKKQLQLYGDPRRCQKPQGAKKDLQQKLANLRRWREEHSETVIRDEIRQLEEQQESTDNWLLLPHTDRSEVQSRANGKYLLSAMVRGVAQGKRRGDFLRELVLGPDCLAKNSWEQKDENLRQAAQRSQAAQKSYMDRQHQLAEWRKKVADVYDRMVNAMDRTVYMVVKLYPDLMKDQPKNEQYTDKQLEQLMDQIMIRAARKLYKQEKRTQ